MKKKKILFSGDTSNRSNWGCRATTYSIRKILEEKFEIFYTIDTINWSKHISYRKNSLCENNIYYGNDLFSNSPAFSYGDEKKLNNENHYEKITLNLCNISKTFSKENIQNFIKNAVEITSHRDSSLINALGQVDLVVINGEGAFIPTNYGAGLTHLALAYISKILFKKPTYIINHSADLRDENLIELSKLVYPYLDGIFVRELHSYNYLTNNLNLSNEKLKFIPDSVFTLSLSKNELWDNFCDDSIKHLPYPSIQPLPNFKEPYICIGGSAQFRYLPKQGFDLIEPYVKLCKNLSKYYQIIIVAIEEFEENYLAKVANKLQLPFISSNLSIQTGVDILGRCQFYIGGRWHSAIKASLGGAPCFMFGTNSSFKTKGFIDLFDYNYQLVDYYKIAENVDVINSFIKNRLDYSVLERNKIMETSINYGITCKSKNLLNIN